MAGKIRINNPMARALFTHSRNAAQAVAIDTRPKAVATKRAYRRNDKHRRRQFEG